MRRKLPNVPILRKENKYHLKPLKLPRLYFPSQNIKKGKIAIAFFLASGKLSAYSIVFLKLLGH